MNETAARAKRAVAALRAADQTGMGRVAGGMGEDATDRLAELDACAIDYRAWSPLLIPGVLQTSKYTAAAIKGRTPSLDNWTVGQRTQHRRWRAEAFLERHKGLATPAHFVIGEAAITRPLMNAHAHAEQLRHLLRLREDYSNIIFHVLREDSIMPGTVEPFSLFRLEQGAVVGHLESLIGGWYTVATEDIARLHSAFSDMTSYAMGVAESTEYIREALSTCWEPTVVPPSSSPATPIPTIASTWPGPQPDPSA